MTQMSLKINMRCIVIDFYTTIKMDGLEFHELPNINLKKKMKSVTCRITCLI